MKWKRGKNDEGLVNNYKAFSFAEFNNQFGISLILVAEGNKLFFYRGHIKIFDD